LLHLRHLVLTLLYGIDDGASFLLLLLELEQNSPVDVVRTKAVASWKGCNDSEM
jgi:hypothetical protein